LDKLTYYIIVKKLKNYKNNSIFKQQIDYINQMACDSCLVITDAIKNGHSACLKIILKNDNKNNTHSFVECALAASCGHLSILKLLRKAKFGWNELTCALAALRGHLDCLRFAHKNGCPWDSSTCSNAAYDQFKCLRYAHKNGCKLNDLAYFNAKRNGGACFEYIKKNYHIDEEDMWFYHQNNENKEGEEEEEEEEEERRKRRRR